MRDDVKLIIATSWEPNRDAFLAKLGVSSGGLGEQFFGSVYNALFVHAIEVRREFARYYSVEYATLSDYLEIRYGEVLSEDELGRERVFLVTWLPQVLDEAYEDNKLDAVLKCVEELERAQLENQT